MSAFEITYVNGSIEEVEANFFIQHREEGYVNFYVRGDGGKEALIAFAPLHSVRLVRVKQ